MGLYLSSDYGRLNKYNSYSLPFTVDTSGSQCGYRAASVNASSYWVSNNRFVPPVSGMYSVDYTVVSEEYGNAWISKDSTTSTNNNKMFGSFYYYGHGTVESTHVTLLTTTADEWFFMVRNKDDGYILKEYNKPHNNAKVRKNGFIDIVNNYY
jgi:hypothetical protein